GFGDVWVVRIDALGTILWERSFGGSSDEVMYSIEETGDAGFILAGTSASRDGDVSNGLGGDDYWIIKLDNSGNLQWEKSLGSSNGNELATSIQQTEDGGFIVSGFTDSNDGDVSGNHSFTLDYWIVKLN